MMFHLFQLKVDQDSVSMGVSLSINGDATTTLIGKLGYVVNDVLYFAQGKLAAERYSVEEIVKSGTARTLLPAFSHRAAGETRGQTAIELGTPCTRSCQRVRPVVANVATWRGTVSSVRQVRT